MAYGTYGTDVRSLQGSDGHLHKIKGDILYITINETSTATATLTATTPFIDEYYDGLMIAFRWPFANVANSTLNINGLGAKPIYYSVNTATAGYFSSGAIYIYVYSTNSADNSGNGCWKAIKSYDSGNNGDYRHYYYTNLNVSSHKVFKYSLFSENEDGTFESFTDKEGTATDKVANSNTNFKIGSPILYYASSTASSTTAGTSSYIGYHACYGKYTGNFVNPSSGLGFVACHKIYMCVTLHGDGTYSPKDQTAGTLQSILVTDAQLISGNDYILIGSTYTTIDNDFQFCLFIENPFYHYDGTSLVACHPNDLYGFDAPVMTSTTIGVAKLGSDTVQTIAAGQPSSTSGKTYPVQLNADDQLVVNVPWTNTNTDTKVTDSASTNKSFLLGHTSQNTTAEATTNANVYTSAGKLYATSGSIASTDASLVTGATVYTAINSALTSVLKYKGTIGSTGATITALPASHNVGDVYVVKTAGTYAGKACEVGDYIICNTSGTTANNAHWDVINGENQVSSDNNTASWGSTVTVGTVDGTDLKFTMPSNPNIDTKVTTTTTTSKYYITGITTAPTSAGVNGAEVARTTIYTDASGNITNENGNIDIIIADTDKFVNYYYSNGKAAGASWRAGVLGTGSSNANYYTIQSGTSSTSSTTWNTAIRIGQNDFITEFGAGSIKLNVNAGSTKTGTLSVATLSAAQTWTLPDKTGTIALTSDIPSLSSYVAGPGSSTDNAIARFDGTTGKIIQNSAVTISDTGQIQSTVATGTAPFVIASTTAVTNLNADLLDGKHASSFALSDHTHISLKADTDDRSVDTIPNDYNAVFKISGLKSNSTIGISNEGSYSAVFGIRAWTDSTCGNAHEFALTNGHVYVRTGATTTWNDWQRIAYMSDMPNGYGKIDCINSASGTTVQAALTTTTYNEKLTLRAYNGVVLSGTNSSTSGLDSIKITANSGAVLTGALSGASDAYGNGTGSYVGGTSTSTSTTIQQALQAIVNQLTWG